MFKNLSKKVVNFKNTIVTALTTVCLSVMTTPAFAGSFTLSNQSGATAEDLGNKAINKILYVGRIAGGVLIVVSIVLVAIGFITTSNRPEKRQELYGRFGSILIGAFLLGAAAVVASFIFNIAN